MGGDEGVGVTASNTLISGRIVASAELGGGGDDVSVLVGIVDVVPDLVFVVVVDVGDPWGSVQGSNSEVHPSSDEMLPVAVPFGEHFLNDHGPEGAILTDSGEETLAVGSHWHAVVNDLGEGDTQAVHVHGVDTCLFEAVRDHNVVDSLWVLSESAHGGHDPAVANVALSDVANTDTCSPEVVRGETWFTDSLPLDVQGGETASLTEVLPVDGVLDGEVEVLELLCSLSLDGVVVIGGVPVSLHGDGASSGSGFLGKFFVEWSLCHGLCMVAAGWDDGGWNSVIWVVLTLPGVVGGLSHRGLLGSILSKLPWGGERSVDI